MHPCFDLYATYLRRLEAPFDPGQAFELTYAIHSMRSYAPEKQPSGSMKSVPQVRTEGTLRMVRPDPGRGLLRVEHTRSWGTWLNQAPASEQVLQARVEYRRDAVGSLIRWAMDYASTPILPVKSFRLSKLEPFAQTGSHRGRELTLQGADGTPPRTQATGAPLTSLYTLIERLQCTTPVRQTVDLLDDLTMLRRGLTLRPMPSERVVVAGDEQALRGCALVGPAIMPLYFWLDAESRVVAIIGRNLAYTLMEAGHA